MDSYSFLVLCCIVFVPHKLTLEGTYLESNDPAPGTNAQQAIPRIERWEIGFEIGDLRSVPVRETRNGNWGSPGD